MSYDLINAITAGDAEAIRQLVSTGHDANGLSESGDTPLTVAVSSIEDAGLRRQIVELLLSLGSLPKPNPKGCGPLFSAVIQMDYDVLALLLAHGADPNQEHDMGESLYEWAEFDYRYEAWDLELPESSTDADRASEAAWLEFLDRLAVKFGKQRPTGLRLLLEHGAMP